MRIDCLRYVSYSSLESYSIGGGGAFRGGSDLSRVSFRSTHRNGAKPFPRPRISVLLEVCPNPDTSCVASATGQLRELHRPTAVRQDGGRCRRAGSAHQ